MSLRAITRKPKNALVKFEDKTQSIIKTTLLRPQGGIHRQHSGMASGLSAQS